MGRAARNTQRGDRCARSNHALSSLCPSGCRKQAQYGRVCQYGSRYVSNKVTTGEQQVGPATELLWPGRGLATTASCLCILGAERSGLYREVCLLYWQAGRSKVRDRANRSSVVLLMTPSKRPNVR